MTLLKTDIDDAYRTTLLRIKAAGTCLDASNQGSFGVYAKGANSTAVVQAELQISGELAVCREVMILAAIDPCSSLLKLSTING